MSPLYVSDLYRLQKNSLKSAKIVLNLRTKLFSSVAALPRHVFRLSVRFLFYGHIWKYDLSRVDCGFV